MGTRTLFLTLRVFSATGGIEKVCRVAGKALYELGLQHGGSFKLFSLHCNKDAAAANAYFPQTIFSGFGNKPVKFIANSLRAGRRADVVLLSHINLLLPGVLIKMLRPSVKLVLITHGIEVWQPFMGWRKKMLKKVDLFLPVSHFTKDTMMAASGLTEAKFTVLNNCLDPFLQRPLQTGKAPPLLNRYGLNKTNQILLTVSRMADSEQYKGYDKVIEALPSLRATYPNLRYLLVGKYDIGEKQRLDALISKLGLQDIVLFAGFVPDEEMPAHFTLADIFIMPSEGEGFGIVFIEAMFYGLPVIAGNKDGSVDALGNGALGTLVNPDKQVEISEAVNNILDPPSAFLPDREALMKQFGYEGYKRRLNACLN